MGQELAANAAISVTIYTTGRSCMQCRYTEKRFEDADVPTTVVDITRPENAALREYVTDELGYSQVPVVVVDGSPEDHWSGLQPENIDRIAAHARQAAASAAPRRTAAERHPSSPFARPSTASSITI